MVVLDKPAGLPAVPIEGSDTPSALSLLSEKLALKRQRAFVVHRIDRFTSGVLLFCENSRRIEILPVRGEFVIMRLWASEIARDNVLSIGTF